MSPFAVLVLPPLLLIALTAIPTAKATASSGGSGGNNNTSHPSAATLAGCQQSCGNLTFDYPFGIGSPRCFWSLDFKLICNNNTTETPRLFLSDGITEVVDDLDIPDTNGISVSFSYSIPMVTGFNVYNKTWKVPGRHLTLDYARLNITGCDFSVFQLLDQQDTTTPLLLCAVTCPNKEITENVARQNCNGTGCCSIWISGGSNALQFQFIRKSTEQLSHRRSLWDNINITTVRARIAWNMIDQPTCASTLLNRTNYACVSNNSMCSDYRFYSTVTPGYNCYCAPGYQGNPYLLNGCKRDEGYNPFPQKVDCTKRCGDISVPFPFGLEEGCSARKLFLLNCTNMSTSSLQLNTRYRVTDINVNDGLVGLEDTYYEKGMIYGVYIPDEPYLYVGSGESSQGRCSISWRESVHEGVSLFLHDSLAL